MTEAEWLACTNLYEMIDLLIRQARSARSSLPSRKFRLFGCAICRQFWERFPDERCREALETSERFSDGLAKPSELGRACRGAKDVYAALKRARPRDSLAFRASEMVMWVSTDSIQDVPGGVARAATQFATALAKARKASVKKADVEDEQERWQIELLCDLFGNPFSPLPHLAPGVISWNGSTVVKLAQAIYDERAFDRMPILADALEEAGCSDSDILSHCRSEGEHLRGCWVVDLCLGKE
jgi:hypothetical protein